MKKNDLKYVIDATLFIDILSIMITGLLLAFVIPEGKGFNKYLLGLHRHEWGDIHLYLSLILVVLLVFHIWYNRVWVINSTKRYFGENWRRFLWGLSFGWIFVIFIGWVFIVFFNSSFFN